MLLYTAKYVVTLCVMFMAIGCSKSDQETVEPSAEVSSVSKSDQGTAEPSTKVSSGWLRSYASPELELVLAAAPGKEGALYVVGSITNAEDISFESADGFLYKYNFDGSQVWGKRLATDELDGVAAISVASDGTIAVAGITNGSMDGQQHGPSGADVFVQKFTANGETQWVHQFGSDDDDRVTRIVFDSSNSLYVIGVAGGPFEGLPSGDSLWFLRKLDSEGVALWTRELQQSETIVVTVLAIGPGDALYVGGVTTNDEFVVSEGRDFDAFVAKYDQDGDESWSVTFGTPQLDELVALALGRDGSIYAAGQTFGVLSGHVPIGNQDGFLRKLNPDGKELWTRQFDTEDGDRVIGMPVARNDDVYVLGEGWLHLPGYNSPIPFFQKQGTSVTVLRAFDQAGNERWTQVFDPERAGAVGGMRSILMSGPGEFFVVGNEVEITARTDVDQPIDISNIDI